MVACVAGIVVVVSGLCLSEHAISRIAKPFPMAIVLQAY
jgi:hypothetical protein